MGLVKNGCMDKGAIQHEMNHALGFIHEQARSDRDRFVKIMWEHIVAGTSTKSLGKHTLSDEGECFFCEQQCK